MFRIALLSMMLTIVIVPPAFAYVDPGGTAIIVQILAAIGAAGFFMIRRVREFFAALFLRRRNSEDSNQGESE